MVVVTMVFLAIFMTSSLNRFLSDAAQGGISLVSVFQVLSLQLPSITSYLLPLGFFIGVLLGLGRLYADSEVAVMHACGVSRLRLYLVVATVGVGVAIFILFLMGVLAPKLESAMSWVKKEAELNISVEKILPGRFDYLGKQVVLYANSSSVRKGYLKDIFLAIHDPSSGNQQDSWKLILADKLTQSKTDLVNQPNFIF